jgi:hypothetical protein
MATVDPDRTRPHRHFLSSWQSTWREHYIEEREAAVRRSGNRFEGVIWTVLGVGALLLNLGRRSGGAGGGLLRWGCIALVVLMVVFGILAFLILSTPIR